jgi:hypothetical protein
MHHQTLGSNSGLSLADALDLGGVEGMAEQLRALGLAEG